MQPGNTTPPRRPHRSECTCRFPLHGNPPLNLIAELFPVVLAEWTGAVLGWNRPLHSRDRTNGTPWDVKAVKYHPASEEPCGKSTKPLPIFPVIFFRVPWTTSRGGSYGLPDRRRASQSDTAPHRAVSLRTFIRRNSYEGMPASGQDIRRSSPGLTVAGDPGIQRKSRKACSILDLP